MYGHSPIQTLYNKAKVYTYAFDSRERERDTQKGKKETVWSLLSFPPLKKKQNGCNRNRYTTVVVKNLLLPTQR